MEVGPQLAFRDSGLRVRSSIIIAAGSVSDNLPDRSVKEGKR
jgi:hypothetical protein